MRARTGKHIGKRIRTIAAADDDSAVRVIVETYRLAGSLSPAKHAELQSAITSAVMLALETAKHAPRYYPLESQKVT